MLLVAAAALLVGAAASPAVDIWSATDIKQAALASGIDGKPLGSFGNHSAEVWRRDKPGQAELHRTKTDLLIVEDGEATLVYGGTIPDARSTSVAEVRGTSIAGGMSRKLGPGDVIRIPPNTPHQFILAKGKSISYLAVKIAR